MMGKYIRESRHINESFLIDYLNLSATTQLNQIRKFKLGKVVTMISRLGRLLQMLMYRKYKLCYMTISAGGVGFLKDLLFIFLLKIFRVRIVYHFHNKGLTRSANPLLAKIYSFVFNHNFSIILSDYLHYDIAPFMNPQRVFICPNGIPARS